MEVLTCGRFTAGERTTQGKYSGRAVLAKKDGTASTGVSSSGKATLSTQSEFELPEAKTHPSEVEKIDVESGASTFKREHPQLEGNDDWQS